MHSWFRLVYWLVTTKKEIENRKRKSRIVEKHTGVHLYIGLYNIHIYICSMLPTFLLVLPNDNNNNIDDEDKDDSLINHQIHSLYLYLAPSLIYGI